MKYLFVLLFIVALLFSCEKEVKQVDQGNKVLTLNTPIGFPYPNIPSDNLPTQNRIDLGKKLFFDPILSRDSSISCASCHFPEQFFQDNLAVSIGIEGRTGRRSAPSLLNVAYLPYVFWDGGVPNLEQQILAPIEDHNEMDFDVNEVVKRLRNHPEYVQMSKAAYDQEPSPFVLTRAIANFERTLFTGISKFDRFLYLNDSNALNASEKNGMTMFFNETADCFHCHNTFDFTTHAFENNALYSNYADSGRAGITLKREDVGKFKVPSLRNIEHTAPYMHDGSLETLEDVIAHYNSGGMPHPNKGPFIKPLNLTLQEKQDLLAFLKALSDE